MSKLLADAAKQRENTHEVVVSFKLPAVSPQHASMVIKNAVGSSYHDADIISSKRI